MKRYNLFITVPLLISLFIYVFYRSENTVVNNLVIYLASIKEYREVKLFINIEFPINDYLIYSLPEGLWIFCTTLISRDFYFRWKGRTIGCGYFPIFFSIILEFFQLVGITNGTFDPSDIIFATIFWAIAFCFIKSPYKRINILAERKIRSLSFVLSYAIVFLSDVWV